MMRNKKKDMPMPKEEMPQKKMGMGSSMTTAFQKMMSKKRLLESTLAGGKPPDIGDKGKRKMMKGMK